MRFIFIEGVSGVGKSTTTQKLCDKLRGMGFSADRYREFDFPNPIDFYSTAYNRFETFEKIICRIMEDEPI